ncbi:glycosyltransferase [Longibacter salinarum]|uniref:glycosyltransferase n=1 Tax=Longibacter salinarum TaxID=1850348 RepID=UPI0015CF6934|nr:glycosyltransferase [Longibacter salinarum]
MTLFFVVAFLIQCLYAGILVVGLRRAGQQDPVPEGVNPDDLPSLSIVVAAHNEADTIPPLLRALASQTHPNLDIILVNDASTDETGRILTDWADDHASARVIERRGSAAPNKKKAIAEGVAAARHDIIAQTDADCVPPTVWSERLAASHAQCDRPVLLIGYSPVEPETGLLNRWSRYETWQTGAFTAAAAAIGHPYMAVGRNLSAAKQVYLDVDNDIAGDDLLSGDDDLFVQAARRTGSATIRPLVDPSTFVPTRGADSWLSWLQQKRRHVSAGRAYAPSTAAVLTLYHSSHVLLWLAPILLGSLGVGLLAARLLFHSLVIGEATRTLGEDDLAAFFPIGEVLTALYHVLVVPFGLMSPPDTWKS